MPRTLYAHSDDGIKFLGCTTASTSSRNDAVVSATSLAIVRFFGNPEQLVEPCNDASDWSSLHIP